MARIRTIKPEFWTSEQVTSCSPIARLLFIGMWNFCDDNGVHSASYVRIKGEVFPIDSISIDEIKKLISELIHNRLIREYAVEDESYWIVTGWKKHQRIDRPTNKFPLPQSDLIKLPDNSSSNPRDLSDHSTNSRRLLDESSTPDRNGKEGNGKEDNICEVFDETPQLVASSNHSVADNDVQEIFSYWQLVMNHPRAKLDETRTGKIAKALKLGYTINELKQAIDGCSKTPHNLGDNDRGRRFDDIELICRDASHIESFIESAINPPSEAVSSKTKNNLMLGVI